MDNKKKILILYASAGHGHEKAAKAVLDACKDMANVTASVVDTLSLAPSFYGKFYRRSYLMLIQDLPWIWGLFYYALDIPWVYAIMRLARRLVNAITSRRLERFVLTEKPDVIIAAHFLSVEVCSHLIERRKINAKLVSVVTDYLPHYVWTAKCVDHYAVALPETKEMLVRWGTPPEKIQVTGIPVEKKFLEKLSTEEARAKLLLDSKAFTLLITSGGAGIGAMKDIVKRLLELKKQIQILAVCGTNASLFEALSAEAAKNPLLKVYAFVNNMQELMTASDLIIGKGGGLTLTESFSKNKPMILFQSIPGQEARNVYCVKKYGAGIAAQSLEDVISGVVELLESPEKLESMKQGVKAMFKPDAAKDIATMA